jgi:hypothetical protein
MEVTRLTLADVFWALIGAVSFFVLMLCSLIIVGAYLLLGEGYNKLIFIPVLVVLWGVWVGIVMVVKQKRRSK